MTNPGKSFALVALLGGVGLLAYHNRPEPSTTPVVPAPAPLVDPAPSPVPVPAPEPVRPVRPQPTSRNTVLFFTQDGCPPCKRMKAQISAPEVQLELQGFVFKELSGDRPMIRRYRVKATPTLVITAVDGHELYRHEGYLSSAQLTEALKSHR